MRKEIRGKIFKAFKEEPKGRCGTFWRVSCTRPSILYCRPSSPSLRKRVVPPGLLYFSSRTYWELRTTAGEFYRVLRPGGSLVVTMDVSLDGTPGIDMQKGTVLLSTFQKQFGGGVDLVHQFRSQWQRPRLFTTRMTQKIDPRLIPWYLPWILHRYKTFLTTFRFPPWPPLLSVFYFTLTRPSL